MSDQAKNTRYRPITENSSPGRNGFTLLELIVVMFLIALIFAISTVFFANTLPSGRFNSTVREIAATMRHARSLAKSNAERYTVTIDIDSRMYGIDGLGKRQLPDNVNVTILDPLEGEIRDGTYSFVFHPFGSDEVGSVVLQYKERTVVLEFDPVAGTAILNEGNETI